MSGLLQILTFIGDHDVITGISHGNVFLETNLKDPNKLTHHIMTIIKRSFQFESSVVVRTKAEIKHIVNMLRSCDLNKLAVARLYQLMTIRNSNTVRKIAEWVFGS